MASSNGAEHSEHEVAQARIHIPIGMKIGAVSPPRFSDAVSDAASEQNGRNKGREDFEHQECDLE